jgi:xanthine/uracil permease
MLMWLIIDAINEGGIDGAYILLIGSNARELWPSMFKEAKEKASHTSKRKKMRLRSSLLSSFTLPTIVLFSTSSLILSYN